MVGGGHRSDDCPGAPSRRLAGAALLPRPAPGHHVGDSGRDLVAVPRVPARASLPWATSTYAHFAMLAAQQPEAGVRMRTGTYRLRPDDVDHWWEGLVETRTVMTAPDYELLRFVLPMVDMPVYLAWLSEQLAIGGVVPQTRHVRSFSDVDGADVIVNCSGLGSRELAADTDLHPLRGQVVLVRQPDVTEFAIDAGGPTGLAHVFPRLDTLVLGGVTEESDSRTPDDSTTRAILDRCTALEPRLADAEVLGVVVGLRPARSSVRLEADHEAAQVPVIHNYGHGGGGVTLSWGCAEEVRMLCTGIAGGHV